MTRITHTHMDMMQEKRINDYGNVDGDRTLSDSWTGFTKFTLLSVKSLPEHMWSGRRLTKIQAPEKWSGMLKAAQKKGKAGMGF